MKAFPNYRRIYRIFAVVGLLAAGMLVGADGAAAQTTRRNTKKTVTKQAPQVLVPIGVPQQDLPVVVSRAEDFQNQNQQIITNGQTSVQGQSGDDSTQQSGDVGDRPEQVNSRSRNLESGRRNDYEVKQKRLLMNLDILTKAEQRSDSLRKQVFELIEKENNIKTKLEQLDGDLRPEMIERTIAFAGSLRPEELRESRRRNLEAERRNLQTLLAEIQSTRANLEITLQKSDILVEKLRSKLEKDIDDTLSDEEQ